MALLVALCMTTMLTVYAQGSAKVEEKVNAMVEKYDGVEDVTCVTLVKGRGLEMVKMMFYKEFGKDFMKGVKSITIIEYSDATPATCQAIHEDLDGFLALLEEFNVGNEKQFADNDYIRSFAKPSGTKTLSDFVIALEDKESKMIMYMAGEIKVE